MNNAAPVPSLVFQSANVIVIGTFNIHILNPAWLQKVGAIAATDAAPSVQVDFSRPGFRIIDAETHITWKIEPFRLVAETDKGDVDCGTRLAHVLRGLPETPVSAIGANFVFKISDKTGIPPVLDSFPSVPGYDTKSQSAIVQVAGDHGRQIALQFGQKEGVYESSGNVETRGSEATELAEAAVRFEDDRNLVRDLLNKTWIEQTVKR